MMPTLNFVCPTCQRETSEIPKICNKKGERQHRPFPVPVKGADRHAKDVAEKTEGEFIYVLFTCPYPSCKGGTCIVRCFTSENYRTYKLESDDHRIALGFRAKPEIVERLG